VWARPRPAVRLSVPDPFSREANPHLCGRVDAVGPYQTAFRNKTTPGLPLRFNRTRQGARIGFQSKPRLPAFCYGSPSPGAPLNLSAGPL